MFSDFCNHSRTKTRKLTATKLSVASIPEIPISTAASPSALIGACFEAKSMSA